MWKLKATVIIFFMAFISVMALRIVDYSQGCLQDRTVYPPVYQCGIHPLNFASSYIEMNKHNRAMSEWIDSGMKFEDRPYMIKSGE
jgi:hypothetical protein